jgi:hypothetical protein
MLFDDFPGRQAQQISKLGSRMRRPVEQRPDIVRVQDQQIGS